MEGIQIVVYAFVIISPLLAIIVLYKIGKEFDDTNRYYDDYNSYNNGYLNTTQNPHNTYQDDYMSKASRRRAKRRKNRERRNNEIINTPKTKHKLETDEMFKKMGIIKENRKPEDSGEEDKNQ